MHGIREGQLEEVIEDRSIFVSRSTFPWCMGPEKGGQNDLTDYDTDLDD